MLAIPKPVLWWLARRERGWARAADAHHRGQRRLRRLGRRALGPRRPAHGRARTTRNPSPPPDPRPTSCARRPGSGQHPDPACSGAASGPTSGSTRRPRRCWPSPTRRSCCSASAGAGTRASPATPIRATPGRHFTLPAVHPDELPAWVASADVAMNALPPICFSQRYTFLNKFFEAMTGGLPMVLGPDLPTMEAVLVKEDLGRVAASMDPADIAAAVRDILDRSPRSATPGGRASGPPPASATPGPSPRPPTRTWSGGCDPRPRPP